MQGENYKNFLFFRHSLPGGDVNEYPGLSQEGVDLAKGEKAKNFVEFMEECDPKTVLFIGAASENSRTKSTAIAIGEGVKQIIVDEKREDMMIINWDDVQKIKKEENPERMAAEIARIINQNPEKKIIVDTPLVSGKYLSFGQWSDEYYDALAKATGSKDKFKYAELWMKTGGAPIDGVKGPDPIEVAKQQLRLIKTLEGLASHYGVKDRPMIVAPADHSWHMAALAVYLKNRGKIDSEGVRELGGEIKEGEIMHIKVKNGEGFLIYNGIEYSIDFKLIEDVYNE